MHSYVVQTNDAPTKMTDFAPNLCPGYVFGQAMDLQLYNVYGQHPPKSPLSESWYLYHEVGILFNREIAKRIRRAYT